MSGRPGTLPDLRHLTNDKRHAHRHAGVETPKPSSNRPEPPRTLSERAREIFVQFVKRIEEVGIASVTDIDIIILYSNNEEQLESYEYILRSEGSTYETFTRGGDKIIKPRPELGMYESCKNLKFKILTEFGLTPAARKRVSMKIKKPEEKKNPFSSL